MDHPSIVRPTRQNGFSLLEALIALTILGVALLLGAALLLQHPRVLKRLDAERQAYRAIEATLESLRAGQLPLQSLEMDGFQTAAGSAASKQLALRMVVQPAHLPGLYQVILEARYPDPFVAGKALTKRTETLVWEQPAPGVP